MPPRLAAYCGDMIAEASAPVLARFKERDAVSFKRLIWVAPLTVIASLAACIGVRFVVGLVDPSAASMGQLQTPMFTLTVEGAVAATAVFMLFALFVPRPNFWYRIVGSVALLVSLVPDVALAIGGAPMMAAMSFVGPLTSIGMLANGGQNGPPQGATPSGGAGGPPPGFMSSMPFDQVLTLMLLHVVVGMVCIVLLTRLGRSNATRQSLVG
jgi:hypothetical protein